jgi:CheY-like chemotaxis protein
MMPPPNGYHVCQALKSDERTKKIPVILLSALTQKTEVEMGFSAGADRYLSKPFMNDDLLVTIQSLLEKKP